MGIDAINIFEDDTNASTDQQVNVDEQNQKSRPLTNTQPMPENWFQVTHSATPEIFVTSKTRYRKFDKDLYKKMTIDISKKVHEELTMQPAPVSKSIAALLEFAVDELRRQNKQIVIDFDNKN